MAALLTFMSMMIISYIWGQIKYPIPYNTGKIAVYLLLSIGLGMISFKYFRENYIISNIIFVIFLIFVVFKERTLLKKFLKK